MGKEVGKYLRPPNLGGIFPLYEKYGKLLVGRKGTIFEENDPIREGDGFFNIVRYEDRCHAEGFDDLVKHDFQLQFSHVVQGGKGFVQK